MESKWPIFKSSRPVMPIELQADRIDNIHDHKPADISLDNSAEREKSDKTLGC